MRDETDESGTATGQAVFDEKRLYRYRLSRRWDASLPMVAWCMLNPSTADASSTDPTLRRVVGFSRSWGFGRLDVVNLFALRATDPSELRRAADPVGPENDLVIRKAAKQAHVMVVAWGNGGLLNSPGSRSPRCDEVGDVLEKEAGPVWCLGYTRKGQPRHPLYLRPGTELRTWDFRP